MPDALRPDAQPRRAGSRLVVFFGNCQAPALLEIYRRHFANLYEEQVVGCELDNFDDALLASADVVVEQLFNRPRIKPGTLEIALCSNAYSPFESQELPIHPNLAAHFRLRYATATTQYRHQAEGGFTFAQYVRRYLRYEWNRELYQALHLWEGRETDDALALLDRALLTSPCSPAGLRLKAHLHLRQNDLPAARAAALGAVAAAPDDPDLHAQVAEVALAQGDLLGAEAALCTAMVFLPGSVRFHIPLAEVLQRAGRAGEAADLLAGLAEQTPGDARLLGRLGWAYRHLPDLQAAEAMFRRAIEADPSYDNARIGLVSTLNELGRHDESLAQLRGMVAADSKDPETYVHLGHLLRERSDLAGAEASFGRAIELAPTWTALHDALASVRRAKQQAGATVPP